MSIDIKNLEESDVPSIVELIREFAAFEDLSDKCEVTAERLHAALFGPGRVTEGLVAFDGRRHIGYALFFPNFSSFRGQRGFYVDDLYVTAEYRGRNVGKMLLGAIAERGRLRGYERLDLLVLDWNAPALAFYERLGAVRDDDERHYKFTDDAFWRLSGDERRIK